MGLTLGLTTAVSGLSTAQKGLDLVSHNIANVNTEGYTRKIFSPESRVLAGKGAGVQAGAITRDVDEGLLKNIRKEGGIYAKLGVLDGYYSRMQDMWGETGSNTSVSHMINTLNEELETLAVSPSFTTAQSTAVDSLVRVANKLNAMSSDIQALRLEADRAIETDVTTINTLLTNISNLNDKIVKSIATEQPGTADLQDKRDLAMQQLSEMIDVQAFVNTNGSMVVFSSAGTALVDSTANQLTHAAMTLLSPWQTKSGGDINNITVSNFDITSDIGHGRLKGLVDVRDQILPDLQAEIDELAQRMMTEANKVHNRGVAYPQLTTSMTGTRTFLDSANQTMNFSSGDTTMTVFDSSGNQAFTTTVKTALGASSGTVDAVATAIQTWLTGTAGLATATAAVDANGHFAINLGSTTYTLAFRDETATAANSTASDVTIQFNSDGDAGPVYEETVSGFSNFLGLNDVYTSSRTNWAWDSTIMTNTATVGVAGTLQFSDQTNGLIFDTLTINTTDTIDDIVARVAADSVLAAVVEAEKIPEGSGYRLRFRHKSGEEMVVSQSGGTTVTTALGLDRSTVGQASYLTVRTDIDSNPQLISRGQMQYSTDKSEYFLSAGDNANIVSLADLFTNGTAFNLAGDMSTSTKTFADYADGILGLNSTQAHNFQNELSYQKGLTESLELKRAEISSVNLDEELANLMILEQSYAAAGKVISTIDRMLEILNGLIR